MAEWTKAKAASMTQAATRVAANAQGSLLKCAKLLTPCCSDTLLLILATLVTYFTNDVMHPETEPE